MNKIIFLCLLMTTYITLSACEKPVTFKLTEVLPDSTYGKIGLKSGDVITQIDDNEICDLASVQNKLANINHNIVLSIIRDGKTQRLEFLITDNQIKIDCWTECRFFKPNCKTGEVNRSLSTIKNMPSNILTDSVIYCDVNGKLTQNQKIAYKLLITSKSGTFEEVKNITIEIPKNQEINPLLKYSNFTFSNPYKGQTVKVIFGDKEKSFYFDGIQVD